MFIPVRSLIIALILILTPVFCHATDPYWDVLIYCDIQELTDAEASATLSGKKIIPALNEIVTDHIIVAVAGTKRVFHCRIRKELTEQYQRIKAYIIAHPELGILYWVGEDSDAVYRTLYDDTDNQAIAMRALRCPVTDGPYTKYVSIYDAINTYGITGAEILANRNLIAPAHRWTTK